MNRLDWCPESQQQDRFAQEAAPAFDPNAPYQQAGPLPKQNSGAVKGKHQGDIFERIDQESRGTAKNKPTQGQYTAADIDRTMEIPATTQNWERPDLNLLPLPSGAKLETGSIVTRLSFPSEGAEEELVGTIQNQLLQPRPKFSIKGSLISTPLPDWARFPRGWIIRPWVVCPKDAAKQARTCSTSCLELVKMAPSGANNSCLA
jgi:hypothetical protein